MLTLELAKGGTSKWRRNPSNLPGPLLLLAVDAGGGFVAVGPTEAKKGRAVATIFEDPFIYPSSKTVFSGHSHEIWITGKGFTRGNVENDSQPIRILMFRSFAKIPIDIFLPSPLVSVLLLILALNF